MFEKEAEEYFRENAYNFDEVTACRECMEFGYNKANKELAEEYRKEHICNTCADIQDCGNDCPFSRSGVQAFLAGLKAGRPQWHDLQKDPNDLPKGYAENTRFLCSIKGETLCLVRYGSFWQGNFEVDAWCEIPIFDKE